MNLTSNEIAVFLFSIGIMLFAARGTGELLRIIKQPIVIGEILAGIILGPTILGVIFPQVFNSLFQESNNIKIVLEGITTISVVMLLLVSGIEVDLSIIVKQGKTAMWTSVMGIVFPFSIGFAFAYLFPTFLGIGNISQRGVFALFVGTALSITALPVVARTLMDLNLFKTTIGYLIIASAMVNDLIGWIIFSIILGLVGSSAHNFSFTATIAMTFGFIIFTLLIGRKLINYILPFIQKKISFPGGVLNFVLILGFLAASFTEYIGIHAIFGAFIIGIAIGDSVHLRESTKEIIQQFVTNIFAPLFFVSIGLRVDFVRNFDLGIVTIFLALAFIGKVVGCGLGAYWGGLRKEESLAVGFGMNSRGAMEIVLGILALQVGLIQEKVFVALVIMALVTSMSSAPFMNIFVQIIAKRTKFKNLIKPERIIFDNSGEKFNVLKHLSDLISPQIKIASEIIYRKIIAREESAPSGIANYIAIPHIKMRISEPVLAICISKKDLDFGAVDGLPSRIIFMLVTPENENELHLKILSEIVKEFSSIDKSKEIIELSETSEIIKMLTLKGSD